MRKLITAALATLLLVGPAVAAVAEPGPNGNNNHGLCTAYFNGNKNGWAKNGVPGPFAALEEAADDGDPSTSTRDDVRRYCEQYGIGGNPSF